jgi:hypothetical protein
MDGERWTHGCQDGGREIDSWKPGWRERDGLMETRTEGEMDSGKLRGKERDGLMEGRMDGER